jgi:hypothetical protein
VSPGYSCIVLGGVDSVLPYRTQGWVVRDSFAILTPECIVTAWLLRMALDPEWSLTRHAIRTQTGLIHVDRCRVDTHTGLDQGRWPPNILLVHSGGCVTSPTGTSSCQPSCPVSKIDETTGEQHSNEYHRLDREIVTPGGHDGYRRPNRSAYTHKKVGQIRGYGDVGGGSRFYPQFTTFKQAVEWLSDLVTV